MVSQNGEWRRKGATVSDKTARAEFGLTQDEIVAAIRAGELQYRLSSMHGTRPVGDDLQPAAEGSDVVQRPDAAPVLVTAQRRPLPRVDRCGRPLHPPASAGVTGSSELPLTDWRRLAAALA